MMSERVKALFGASIEAKMAAADALSEPVAMVAQRLVDCLLNNGKIFVCGNGGSALNAQHFSTAMLNRFDVERPTLPVITLTTDMALTTSLMQEGHADHVFSRPLQALGNTGDVLLLLSTSSQTMNLVHAVDAAHERGMDVVLLGGPERGVLENHLGPEDLALVAPVEGVARIREIHLFVLHCFCDLIDQSLFGHMTG